jgi:integrase
MVKDVQLKNLSFYRLRHSFKTYAKGCGDRDAVDLAMGHKDVSIGKIYDHETISFSRTKRVGKVVYRRLWPKKKPLVNTIAQKSMTPVANGNGDASAAA